MVYHNDKTANQMLPLNCYQAIVLCYERYLFNFHVYSCYSCFIRLNIEDKSERQWIHGPQSWLMLSNRNS